MSEQNYWGRLSRKRLTRRFMLSASAKAGVGAAGLALVGCGGDDDDGAASQAPADQAADQADQATDQAADQADDQAAPSDQADDDEAVSSGPGEPQYGGTIRTWDLTDPISFDQFATFGYQVFLHGHMTYPKLTQLATGPDIPPTQFNPELWLADSVEQPDALTATFTINPAAVWQDIDPTNGREVSTDDILYSYGEPYQEFPNRAILLPHLDSVNAMDAKTVEFKLQRPLAPLLLYLGHQAGPHIYPFEHATWGESRQRAVSAGPWLFEKYEVGVKASYVRNPNYWRQPYPFFDRFEFLFTKDPAAIASALLTGELDVGVNGFFPLERADAPALKAEFPDGNFAEFPLMEAGGVTVDLLLEPFTDNRVRQAVSNAMDRDAMLAVADSSEQGKWQSSLPPLSFWWRDPATDEEMNPFFRRDVQRARQLLDAAGVLDNFPSQTLNTNQGWGPVFVERSQVIQANLREVGINAELNIQANAEFYAQTFPGKHVGSMGHNRMVGTTEPDEPLSFIYRGDSPRSGIPNGEEMDKDEILADFLVRQRQETDRDARKTIIDEFQLYLAEQMYLIPIISPVMTLFARPGIEDMYWISTFAPGPQFEKAWVSNL